MLRRSHRPIRMAQCLAAGVLACGALTFTVNSAQATTDRVYGGTMTVPSVVISTNTCVWVPIRYDLSDMPDGYNWTIEAKSTTGGSTYDYGDGPAKGATDVEWCQEDLPGKFTVRGELTVKDENYDLVTTSAISLRFAVRKMTTRASIKAARKTVKVDQAFRLKGCVTAHRKREPYREIAFEARRPGEKWTRARNGSGYYTDGVGCYSQDVANSAAGTRWWRVRVPGDGTSTTAYSKAVKVKVVKK